MVISLSDSVLLNICIRDFLNYQRFTSNYQVIHSTIDSTTESRIGDYAYKLEVNLPIIFSVVVTLPCSSK